MLERCAILVFLCCLCMFSAIVEDDQNTRKQQQHFIDLGDVDPELGNTIIGSIPVKQFYDVEKQRFKLGFIAEDLEKHDASSADFANLLSTVNRKTYKESKVLVERGARIVDYNSVFGHFISSVKFAINRHDQIATKINDMYSAAYSHSEFLGKNLNSTYEMFQRSASLRIEQIHANHRVTCAKKRADHTLAKYKLKMDNLEYLTNSSLLMTNAIKESIISEMTVKSRNITGFITQKFDDLLKVLQECENVLSSSELEDFRSSLGERLRGIQRDLALSVDLNTFKVMEENRMAKQNEKLQLNLLKSKAEFSRTKINYVVKSVIAYVMKRMTNTTFTNSRELITHLAVFLIMFCVTILLYEVLMSLGTFLRYRFIRGNIQKFSVSLEDEEKMHIFSDSMKQNLDMIASRVACANKVSGSLPIVLITGISGTGKSETGKKLASLCKLKNRNAISIENLLSVESNLAPLFLRYALASKETERILFLDDADAMIASRSDFKKTSNYLLYTFLEESKKATMSSVIVIATDLCIHQIDAAVLDRIDTTIVLQPPIAYFRFRFLICQIALKLKNFMSDESRKDLDVLSAMEENSAAKFLALNLVAPETAHPVSPTIFTDLSSTAFDIKFCVKSFITFSEGKTFRDVEKFVKNVQLQVLGTERCLLTDALWIQEVKLFRSMSLY